MIAETATPAECRTRPRTYEALRERPVCTRRTLSRHRPLVLRRSIRLWPQSCHPTPVRGADLDASSDFLELCEPRSPPNLRRNHEVQAVLLHDASGTRRTPGASTRACRSEPVPHQIGPVRATRLPDSLAPRSFPERALRRGETSPLRPALGRAVAGKSTPGWCGPPHVTDRCPGRVHTPLWHRACRQERS